MYLKRGLKFTFLSKARVLPFGDLRTCSFKVLASNINLKSGPGIKKRKETR